VRRKLRLAIAGAAIAMVVGIVAAVPAGAAPNPNPPFTGYGFDGQSHIVVGAGSDTTYRAMLGLTDLYDESALIGCRRDTTSGGQFTNTCINPYTPSTNTLNNYDGDTVAQAAPAGSGAGISALDGSCGTNCYSGTVGGHPDFARSSRSESGSELTLNTFWGYAEDGIQVALWNNRLSTLGTPDAGHQFLSWADLNGIWSCTITKWSQITDVPSPIVANSAQDGPIVPWQMNPASGTKATFENFVKAGSGNNSFSVTDNTKTCQRHLGDTDSTPPFENDTKPLLQDAQIHGFGSDPAGLSTDHNSTQNPENWIWFSSFGELESFNFESVFTPTGTGSTGLTYAATPAPVQGQIPQDSNIANGSYIMARTLWHVTKNTDADCPRDTPTSACNFATAGPALPSGGNDINVAGATTGNAGAVREFTRFICRNAKAQFGGLDPYTGIDYRTETTNAIKTAGFQGTPPTLLSSSSIGRCLVHAQGAH